MKMHQPAGVRSGALALAAILVVTALAGCSSPDGLNVYAAGDLGLTEGVDVIELGADGNSAAIGLLLEPVEAEAFASTLDVYLEQEVRSCPDRVLLRFNRSDGFITEVYVVDCGADGRWLTGLADYWNGTAIPAPDPLLAAIEGVLATVR